MGDYYLDAMDDNLVLYLHEDYFVVELFYYYSFNN